MSKVLFSIIFYSACTNILLAQITREQANAIVLQHIQNEIAPPYKLYVYNHAPSMEAIAITTYSEENIKIKYACWAYYLNENPEITKPCQHRYLFVKENDGNLLEIITSNDLGPEELTEWQIVLGVETIPISDFRISVFPNPTTGELRIDASTPISIQAIEIFDVFGKNLLTMPMAQMSSEITLNISHLPSGVYFVRIITETGEVTKKIIKN
jgi:hypothetical protein